MGVIGEESFIFSYSERDLEKSNEDSQIRDDMQAKGVITAA